MQTAVMLQYGWLIDQTQRSPTSDHQVTLTAIFCLEVTRHPSSSSQMIACRVFFSLCVFLEQSPLAEPSSCRRMESADGSLIFINEYMHMLDPSVWANERDTFHTEKKRKREGEREIK